MMKLVFYALVIPFVFGCALVGQSIPNQELNERLMVNNTLFDQWDQGGDLLERAKQTNADVDVRPVIMETPVECYPCTTIDPEDSRDVEAATIQSDLVVIGKVGQNTSALTKNHAFVITDSQLLISEVWKATPKLASQMKTGAEITVANAGGSVLLEGHKISAYLPNLLPLQVGHTYLLFLRYMPASRSYVNSGLDGLDITDEQIIPLHPNVPPPARSLLGNRDRFVSVLHSSTMKAVEREAR